MKNTSLKMLALTAFIGGLSMPAAADGLTVVIQPQGVTTADLIKVLADGKITPKEVVEVGAIAISNALSDVLAQGQICREANRLWALNGANGKTSKSITETFTVKVDHPFGRGDKDSYQNSMLIRKLPGNGGLAVGVYKPGSDAIAKVYNCESKL